ncbi:SDR family NAD(P)-dependent oxidoreductase [Siphonobacter sp. SORGH_AS_0500]|uniref:SDR family NAD(P)-dependent oxidoreductase n=1 Tax=Siphonobacter sp. SORGH_AS_0500 TaxID=1864824 RepID=UPI00285A64B0|nr:SDR family NAD(P)-dependent oxidoreductase [Siphonobacter sp. SORGH_AS_0500]MDR6196342.1 glucose 1-dehydrogenase [Siphonobacter sp. SORGH_AS_0500]
MNVIVTGAAQGIGFEICRQMALRGASVLLNDIDEIMAQHAAARIRSEGGNCQILAGDASDVEFIKRLVQTAVTQFGSLDILVANAGITTFGDFFEYQPESLQKLLDLNIRGNFFLTQQAALQMRSQGQGGRILLMSSVTGQQSHAYLAAYGMTKAALQMLAKSLVTELSPYGITINCVAPGATLTERTLDDPDYTSTWSRITPLKKPATVADIAAAVLFLTSPEAGHITGQTLVVDGGWTSVSPSPY